jgi:hypothetical protein
MKAWESGPFIARWSSATALLTAATLGYLWVMFEASSLVAFVTATMAYVVMILWWCWITRRCAQGLEQLKRARDVKDHGG